MKDWIAAKAEASIDPQRVRVALLTLSQIWPPDYPALRETIEQLPIGQEHLIHLLAVSPISADKIARDPAALLWLAQPEVCKSSRGPGRMLADLQRRKQEGFDSEFKALRWLKAREMLRIALREIAEISSLEQTTLELAQLATVCLREVYDGWRAELSRRWGDPQSDFTVLAMGKFGAQELNYSSDIDVIFIYGEEGWINPRFSYHDFFTRLGEKIIATFGSSDPDGTLFRIDLRLRPEGASGALVRSLESMENYYGGFGESWERMALMKARGVCGSDELAYEFLQRLQPFIFPRVISHDLLDEIAAIKTRIERDIVGQKHLTRNVKLGYGGIREIEFVVQTLQLLHGARNAFLQESSTLKTLRALQQLNLIPADDMSALNSAYRFLRKVEHRLQIEHEQQTHTLPDNEKDLLRLARSLGFESSADFQHTLQTHTQTVRGIFEKLLRPADAAPAAERGHDFFRDPSKAVKTLEQLAEGSSTVHVAPRTKRLFAQLEPLLLDQLAKVADPDVALNRFAGFVERYGIRGLLFETLLTNSKVLELLVRLFDASRFLNDIIQRRPQLLEEIARGGVLDQPLGVSDYLQALERNEEKLPWMDWVRVYRRGQILRIGLRDLLGLSTIDDLHSEYSALAEACLLFVHREIEAQELTVVAMGKFGGRELSYGCDLDIVFVGEAREAAEKLVKSMTATTAEGIVFPIDTRLRPEGMSGLLTIPLSSYATYFENRAQLWEAQALTKARPIAGPQQQEFLALAQKMWRKFAQRDDLFDSVKTMHQRIVRERASNDALDFKTGTGGLMELEFLVQALQMRNDVWEQHTVRALQKLSEQDLLAEETAQQLRDDYLFLRRIEAVVRRVENSSISALPQDENEQRRVATRLGFERLEDFRQKFRDARAKIHREFQRLFS